MPKRLGMTKTYAVDIIGVSRFLYSDDGVKFLKDQTRSYFPVRLWFCVPRSSPIHRRISSE